MSIFCAVFFAGSSCLFFSQLVGIENVRMNTSDASSPIVLIEAVPSSVGFADKLRNQVEIIRQQKRVREIDIE